MNKTLVFDMDGTIADFYGVDGWLEDLHNENPRPYKQASPLYNMYILNSLLKELKGLGWKIVVTTWCSKNATPQFKSKIRQAKRQWLKDYGMPYDELHIVQYGTTKAECSKKNGGYQILFDDNEKVRAGWSLGATVDANKNILPTLYRLLREGV